MGATAKTIIERDKRLKLKKKMKSNFSGNFELNMEIIKTRNMTAEFDKLLQLIRPYTLRL